MDTAPKTITSVQHVFFLKLAKLPSLEGSLCGLTGRQSGARGWVLQPGGPDSNPRASPAGRLACALTRVRGFLCNVVRIVVLLPAGHRDDYTT